MEGGHRRAAPNDLNFRGLRIDGDETHAGGEAECDRRRKKKRNARRQDWRWEYACVGKSCDHGGATGPSPRDKDRHDRLRDDAAETESKQRQSKDYRLDG